MNPNLNRAPVLSAVFACLMLLAAGCSPAPTPANIQPDTVPVGMEGVPAVQGAPADWPESAPGEQDIDEGPLETLQSAITEQKIGLHSLLILRNGTLVFEEYYAGYDADQGHIQYSVTKSFAATLVGIAIDQGYIQSVDQPAAGFFTYGGFANPDPRKDSMTLENVLTMTTGLEWTDDNPTFQKLYSQGDWVKYMFDLPVAVDPGSQFKYCSGCSHILMAALGQSTGQDNLKYARENLFDPLGIRSLTWESDRQNIRIGGWGLYLRPRDMAKLGYLYLKGGDWYGTRVVSEAWVKAASSPHVNAGDFDYGYQWWVHPDLGGYMALGRGGQMVYVQPDKDLVVVTTAEMDGHHKIFDLLRRYILPAVH